MTKTNASEQTQLLEVVVQVVTQEKFVAVEITAIEMWANQAYCAIRDNPAEVAIRIVDEDEITTLNQQYRNINKPTNVLSFAMDAIPEVETTLLGDIVICHQVVMKEAQQQEKSISNHYAHLVMHGVLHLCDFDHENEKDAKQMEKLEIDLLNQFGIANPYN